MSHLKLTWLRSRKRRSSAHDTSQRWPTTIARGGGGWAASPWSPPAPPIRNAASFPDLQSYVGGRCGDGVVVVGVDPHDAAGLRCAKADGEDGAERDRNLSEDIPWLPLSDDAIDAVDLLDRLDATLEQPEERALVAFVRGVLARHQPDVRRCARQALAFVRAERREDRDAGDVLGRHHGCSRSRPARTGQRYSAP